MAETTAASIFSSASGASQDPRVAGGAVLFGGVPGAAGVLATGGPDAFANLDRARLDEDPFRKAAKEQDARFDAALEAAKNATTTTAEQGASTTQETGTTSGTSQTTFAPRGATEQQLLNASIANYAQQQNLVKQQEADIKARGGVQAGARGTLGSIFGGQAFDLSPSEQARIDRLRQSNIDVGSNAVNELLTQRLAEVQADAARRGVRGQAFSQIQGDVLGEAAKSLERQTLEANRLASEQAIALPGQRASIQAGSAGQFAGFADELQQQAIQNRQALQDPVALQQLLDERLKGGKTTTSGTTSGTSQTSSTGVSKQTGAGQADILLAKAQQPSATGAQTAGALGIGQVVGEIIPG